MFLSQPAGPAPSENILQLLRLPDVRAAVAARWDAVLVDECQDLNLKQYEVVKALAGGHRNLFAVGDDEQSIFSWTGAVPGVLNNLVNDFGITSIIVLEENRRNAREIFETARRLLRDNPSLFKKALRATAENKAKYEGMKADLEANNLQAKSEATKVAEQINTAAGDYQALMRLTAELERVGAELEQAIERWSTLAEIAEGG